MRSRGAKRVKGCMARIVRNYSTFGKRNDLRLTLSSSTNAVSFTSACTIKRFPSSRCASATNIVCPLELIVETQPQLQPALLRLSATISQYFELLPPDNTRKFIVPATHPGNHCFPDATFDFIFAKGLTVSQPMATQTTASDHWPVTRDFSLH